MCVRDTATGASVSLLVTCSKTPNFDYKSSAPDPLSRVSARAAPRGVGLLKTPR